MAKFLSRKTNKPKAAEPEEISVPETTPAWLTALLSKYGEEATPYGTPTRPSLAYADEALPDAGPSDDDISDVLADIAVSAPSERIASSVDWGAPPADVEAPAPSSAMDNLLASFGADADVEEVEPEPEPPEADHYPADTPDWLDDVATAPVAETPPEPPPPPAVEEADTPDWLDDISSKPAKPTASSAASADTGTDWLSQIRGDALPAPEEQGQVPDWLVEFAAVGTASLVSPKETSPPKPRQPIQPETPSVEEPASSVEQVDKPEEPEPEKTLATSPSPPEEAAPSFDWLDEMEIPESAQPAEAAPSAAEEAAPSLDWLDEMEIPESAQPAEAPPPAAEEAAPSFDWLDEMEIPESAQPAEAAPPQAKEAAPDWLSDIAKTAPIEQAAASTTEPSPAIEDDLDADWLAEVAAAYPIDPAITESILATDDAPLPEPASDHPAEETRDALAATSALGEIPDWLAADDAEEAIQTEEAAPFGDLPDWMQDETADKPDWLTGAALPQDEEPETTLPGAFESSADLPEWLLDATQETEAEIEALMVDESPVKTEQAEEEDGLNWKTGATGAALGAILASKESESEESPVETKAEAPDWLAELQDDAEDLELEEAALPDWIQTEPEALSEVETPAAAEEAPDWLAELQDDAEDLELEEAALPDWIQTEPKALSEVETPAVAEEATGWLAELQDDAEDLELEEAALPNWIQAGAESEALDEVETPAVAEEAPDWLAELQDDAEDLELEEAALPDWVQGEAEPEAPDEAETPAAETADWLTALQGDVEEAELETAPEVEEDKSRLNWKTGAAGAALGAALLSAKDEAETPAESAKPGAKPEAIPDWLAELYEAEEALTVAKPEIPAEAEESEAKIEAETKAAVEVELPIESAKGKESPDWLTAEPKAQKADIEIEVEALAELSTEDAESPAWLQGLQPEIEAEALEIEEAPIPDRPAEEPEAEATTAALESAEPAAEDEDEGGLDWKAGAAFGAASAALLSEKDQAEEPAGAMEEIEAEAEIETLVEAAESDESPAWLTEIEAEVVAPEIETPVKIEAEAESATPDWLLEVQEDAEAEIEASVEAKEGDESPAWLAEMQAEAEVAAPEIEAPLAVEAESAMSAWLIKMQAEAETETEAEPEVETKTEFAVEVDDDILNWLSEADVEPEAEIEAELSEPDAATLPERDEPAEVEAVAAEEPESEAPVQGDETAEAEEAEEIEEESASNLATAAPGSMLVEDKVADLPDWMSNLFSAGEFEEKIDEAAPGQTADTLDAPEWMLALEADDEEKEKEKPKPEPSPEPSPEDREEGEDKEDPFEGKAGLALGAAGLTAAGAALAGIGSAAPLVDLPDKAGEKPQPEDDGALDGPPAWMSDLGEDEPPAEEIAQIATGLVPPPDTASALPAWMEDLPEPDFGAAEEVGPVERAAADLQDVVSVPSGASGSLEADAAPESGVIGMAAAREFYGIVSPAAKTLPGQRQASSGQTFGGRAFRAGLHLLFLALIAIPLFTHYDRGGYPYPWLEPSPIQQQDVRQELQNAIASQPPDSIALVAFDYTPAVAGEMDPLAAIVIKNLLGQGLRVIAVSLEPEGQAMASSILAKVSDDYGERVLNLGYLPGGPVAVRRLLDDPLFGAADIESGTLYASLDNWPEISRIGDFSLVVELAANPDTARWWAEQLPKAQPNLTMLAAVSAAAEPFVRPYRDAGQYTALISGINGAAALESARVQKTLGPATAMLDSLSAGSLIILVLMFAGTIAGLISRYQ